VTIGPCTAAILMAHPNIAVATGKRAEFHQKAVNFDHTWDARQG
jgi:hypothetical protein